MRRIIMTSACAVIVAGLVLTAQQGPTLQTALAASGANGLRSVVFTATGRAFVLGQPATAADPWPMRDIKSYQVSLDYGTGSMRVEQVLTMPTPAPRGGGGAFTGEQRQVQLVRGAYAWAETTGQGGAVQTNAQPANAADRLMWMWMASPQGLLKAAGTSASRPVADGAELAYTVGGRLSLRVHINKMNQVDRAQALLPNDVFGDMLVETTYAGYKDFGGIQFPTRITQRQGGHPTLDLTVTGVKTNEFVDITVPDNVRNAPAPAAPTATSQNVADGIFWITGGSHHSLAVDLGDHVVVLEGPQNEGRSELVIAETKKVLANKPIRFVVNTHLHFDHSGGLRTFVDEGATVVTHAANQPFYEKAWSAPRTLAPDRLSKSGKKAAFQGVTDRAVLQGTNKRAIELHVLTGNPHNEQVLVAWLPAERILFQSDMMNPPVQGAAVPPPTPTVTNFYDNLARLKIDPEHIVGGHGARVGTRADLMAVTGKGK
jgi:glyoxylase-like metal-dependent hydrolase (beta-lactamase superfamily II)